MLVHVIVVVDVGMPLVLCVCVGGKCPCWVYLLCMGVGSGCGKCVGCWPVGGVCRGLACCGLCSGTKMELLAVLACLDFVFIGVLLQAVGQGIQGCVHAWGVWGCLCGVLRVVG